MWTHILTNKVLELVSKLVVHSSTIIIISFTLSSKTSLSHLLRSEVLHTARHLVGEADENFVGQLLHIRVVTQLGVVDGHLVSRGEGQGRSFGFEEVSHVSIRSKLHKNVKRPCKTGEGICNCFNALGWNVKKRFFLSRIPTPKPPVILIKLDCRPS